MSYRDEETTDDTITSTTRVSGNISNAELEEFRAYRDAKIRAAALAEGRNAASAEAAEREAAADQAALAYLASHGITLRDAFGASATRRGHDVMVITHGSPTRRQHYARLRKLAAKEGLVS